MTKTVCVIPARMGSSRFPGKPLAKLLGLPLVLHVWNRCRICREFEMVAVATCDEEIRNAVTAAEGQAIMTSDKHERATDRTQEAVERLGLDLSPDDFVLMVQGDEVLVSPEMAATMIAAYQSSGADVVNLVSRLYSAADHEDPNVVKVVGDPDGNALYFSRAPIPSRARSETVPMYQQTGVIGFRSAFLTEFGSLPQTPLENIESVDMMRVIEHRRHVRLIYTEQETIGVDTPEELARAEQVLANDPLTASYLAGAS